MKASGIVRRMDCLGRVVLPMEMRRILRIKEGSLVDISMHNSGILIRKYSDIDSLGKFANEIAANLNQVTREQVLICDLDTVLFEAGNPGNSRVGLAPSKELREAMMDRKEMICSSHNTIPIVDNQCEPLHRAQVIAPVIVNHEPIGCVVLMSDEATAKYGAVEKAACAMATRFIQDQLKF